MHRVSCRSRTSGRFRASQDVDLLPVPFEIGRMDFHLYWHASRDADPGNLWFRKMVKRAVRFRADG